MNRGRKYMDLTLTFLGAVCIIAVDTGEVLDYVP